MAGADGAEQQGLHRGDSRGGLTERLEGTLAATALAAADGARMFRVHEVGPTRRVLETVASIKGDRAPARTCGAWHRIHRPRRRAWLADPAGIAHLDGRELQAAKRGRTVSVVLPALNEAETVGAVIDTIPTPMVGGLVDELIVLDSGSTDDTEARARAAGPGWCTADVLPEIAPQPGKGEALWRSLAATSGDIVVFIDSDLIDADPLFGTRGW